MPKHFAIGVLSLGGLLAVPTAGRACSLVCTSEPLKPIDAVKRGDTVFVGESVRLDDPDRPRYALVKVVRAYGDPMPAEVKVAAGMGADCRPYITPGQRFLFVIAEGSYNTVLATDDCVYPIHTLPEAARDLAPLEKQYRKKHRDAVPISDVP